MEQPQTKPVPSERTIPWNPIWAVSYAVITYFAASFAAGILLVLLANVLPLQHWSSEDWINKSTSAQFMYVLLFGVLSVLAVRFFVHSYGRGLRVIGFKRPAFKDVGAALIAYPIYFVFFAALLIIITKFVPGIDVNQEQQLGFDNVQGTVALLLTFISLVIVPPIVEELVVRGLIFTSLRSHIRFLGAAVLTSAIFAVAHLPEGGSGGPLYIAAVDTFILSLVLCFLREKTGSLWAGITLHAIKNGVAYVSLFILATR